MLKESNRNRKVNMEKNSHRLSSFKIPDLQLIPQWLKMGNPKILEGQDQGRLTEAMDMRKKENTKERNYLHQHHNNSQPPHNNCSEVQIADKETHIIHYESFRSNHNFKDETYCVDTVDSGTVSESIPPVPDKKSTFEKMPCVTRKTSGPATSSSKSKIGSHDVSIKQSSRMSQQASITKDDATYAFQAMKIKDISHPFVSTSKNDVQRRPFHQIITKAMATAFFKAIIQPSPTIKVKPFQKHLTVITTRSMLKNLDPMRRKVMGLVGPSDLTLYEIWMKNATKLSKPMYESYLGRSTESDDEDDEDRYFIGVRQ